MYNQISSSAYIGWNYMI